MSKSTRLLAEKDAPASRTFSQRLFNTLLASKVRAFAGIPGPVPSLLLGNGGDFLGRKPWEVFDTYARKYGPMVLVWLGPSPNILVAAPELIRQVLETDSVHYYKNSPAPVLLPFLTNKSEFPTNGERWARNRTSSPINGVLPSRTKTGGEAHGPVPLDLGPARKMLAQCVKKLGEENTSRPIDMRPIVVRMVFDVLSLLAFGTLLGDEGFDEFMVQTAFLHQRMQSVSLLPRPVPLKVRTARRRWRTRLKTLASLARSKSAPARSDILGLTLRSETPLDDDALAAQFGSMFFGGNQSSAAGILSTLYLLSKHPKEGEQVRAEVEALMKRESPCSFEELNACEALDCALLEALRLLPPVPVFLRNTQKEGTVELGGHKLPANTPLLISSWVMHRSPGHYAQPDDFVPGRWAQGGKARDPLGSGYFFPFGRGPRTCTGERLALLTMKLVLAEILAGARLELDDTFEPELFFAVMLPKRLMARFQMSAA